MGRLAVVLLLVASLLAAGFMVAAPGARATDYSTIPLLDLGTQLTYSATLAARNPFTLWDHQGDLYIFYVQYDTGLSVANLHVIKYTLNGILGTPVFQFDHQVNSAANVVNPGATPSAAVDSAGNLYVAWENITGGAPSYSDIFVSKSADGGNTWGNAIPVSPARDGTIDAVPTIAVSPTGTVYVAWTTFKPVYWFYNIRFAESTNGGASFTGVQNISGQGPGGGAILDSMAVDAQGRIYVAYMGEPADVNTTLGYTINVTWSDTGTSWSAPATVSPASSIAIYPSIAVDAQGHVHLIYLNYNAILVTGGIGISYTRSDDRGATWSLPTLITTGAVDPYNPATLSVEGSNLFVVYPGTWAKSPFYQVGLGYLESGNGGASWYPEQFHSFAGQTFGNASWASSTVDSNGTFYVAAQASNSGGAYQDNVDLLLYDAPPSAPSNVAASVSGTNATVSWTAPPEGDVVGYVVMRSSDGMAYQTVGTLGNGATSFVDANLANGTYWYEVEAVDNSGATSLPSSSAQAQIGPSVQDQINQLQNEIGSLQSQLNSANADLGAIQTRLNTLQGQLSSLQGNTSALQTELNNLQNQLNTLQAQQATQTMSYATLAFEVIVVALLVVLLVNQMRKPKRPTLMMAQPGQAAPSKPPEEDL